MDLEIEQFDSIEGANLDGILDRCSQARIVLLGESTHGTSEFYRMRARLTRELILRHGFNIVALETGWADGEVMSQEIGSMPRGSLKVEVLNRFGSWMWRNREFSDFLESLKEIKKPLIYGLDIYGMDASIQVIFDILKRHSPDLEDFVRKCYSGLLPYMSNPVQYGSDVSQRIIQPVTESVSLALKKVSEQLGSHFHLIQNMRLVVAAEEYFRVVYENSPYHWNMRDTYMFETLERILSNTGSESKVVVWAHNSHVGDARGNYLASAGYLNLSQLYMETYPDLVYRIGFGFYTGYVTAAPYWLAPCQSLDTGIPPEDSYEDLFHKTGAHGFFLPLKNRTHRSLPIQSLSRGIGLTYDLSKDQRTNFFKGSLTHLFDEFVWFDQTGPLTPNGAGGGVGFAVADGD